ATSDSWYTAAPHEVGIVLVDGKFRTLDTAGVIHEYADANTGDNASDWWATYQWWTDVNENGNSGGPDYLSRCSPGTRFTWPRRAMVRLLGQPVPDGVDYITPSLAKKPTTPSVAEYRRPSWFSFAGQSKAEYRVLPVDWASTNSPSDTNNFPDAETAAVESASATFRVEGDGSGRWGRLTFDVDGRVHGRAESGQVVIPSPTANGVTTVEVTLPEDRFTEPPEVSLTPYTTSPHQVSAGVWPVTESSFFINLHSTTSSDRRISWVAFDKGNI